MNPSNSQVPPHGQPGGAGFSLTELLIAVTILGALIAIALPMFNSYKDQQNVSLAINDLRLIDNQIKSYKMSNEQLPDALTQVPQGDRKDPWGRLYEYLKIEGDEKATKGNVRKDKATNPINADFDLYSKGLDGATAIQLDSPTGKDDVVRANDGQYFGLASKY
ncbi:MAG: prepilin-type N-terminal cleavage/methylation domain-containing protein [Deltaproteobacteria bacterium]|nr:prepilin-type N-terminal cleavage/methylation domain-containing protein [Deltaproteobacteria bacterium]